MILEHYIAQQSILPKTGKQIIGYGIDDTIVVYQAFNSNIAKYAVTHQEFGGSHYSKTRMTWIKPNFMWMMYRAGWATKPNQEHILAITLTIDGFKEILRNAVHSSFQAHLYEKHEDWKADLEKFEVRLQWDPDHDPFGNKLERKAIQLGLKGKVLEQFHSDWILKIEDITQFVKRQHQIFQNDISKLEVPKERVIKLNDSELEKWISIKKPNQDNT